MSKKRTSKKLKKHNVEKVGPYKFEEKQWRKSGPPKNLKNCLFYLKLGSFGYGKTFGGMVVTCMPNSGHGGCPGSRVMTVFGSYVGHHFPNIQYFDVCGGM